MIVFKIKQKYLENYNIAVLKSKFSLCAYIPIT